MSSLSDKISSLEFDPQDPFDVGFGIFDNLKSYLDENSIRDLEKKCYQQWFEMLQCGEMISVHYYKKLSQLLDQHHSAFFMDMAEEEHSHGMMIRYLNDKMYGTGAQIDEKNQEFYRKEPFMDLGIVYVLSGAQCIEQCVQVVLKTFYEECKNEPKKDFLGTFLEDESHHTQKFEDIIRENLVSLSDHQKEEIKLQAYQIIIKRRFFAQKTVNSYLNSIGRSDLIEAAYKDNHWHDRYQKKLYQRLYDSIKIVDPSLTMDQLINRTQSSAIENT